ncbi:MAG: hypothetical protein B7Z16_06000 [Algoriphagus sp. 32-45-6]|nr:MAG: hypothetical protein B7Z16_06000 [Algoriphagus sp. 32-45-6]
MSYTEHRGIEKEKNGTERSPTEMEKNPDVLGRKIENGLPPKKAWATASRYGLPESKACRDLGEG